MRGREQGVDYWVARRRLGLMSRADEAAFADWLTDPVNRAAFDEAEQIVSALDGVADTPRVMALRRAAMKPRPRFKVWWGAAAAASIAGFVAISQLPPAPTPSEGGVVSKHYQTAVGERANIRLEDGTIVALNTGSALEVAYSPHRRDVRLLRGQALFEVARNKQRPFVVTAADRRVTALGTAFDVRMDEDGVKVVLVEGRVAVDPVAPSGLARLAPILVRRELEPGEALTAESGGDVEIASADTNRATSWRRGQLIFRDDSLADAVAELNRYSVHPLALEGQGIADLKVSGVFGATRPENFVAAVTAYYPLEAQQRADGSTVLVWRDRTIRAESASQE